MLKRSHREQRGFPCFDPVDVLIPYTIKWDLLSQCLYRPIYTVPDMHQVTMKESAPKRVGAAAEYRPSPFACPITKFGLLLLWLAPFCSCQPDSLSLQHGRVLEAMTDGPSRIGEFDNAWSTLTLLNTPAFPSDRRSVGSRIYHFRRYCVCALSNNQLQG